MQCTGLECLTAEGNAPLKFVDACVLLRFQINENLEIALRNLLKKVRSLWIDLQNLSTVDKHVCRKRTTMLKSKYSELTEGVTMNTFVLHSSKYIFSLSKLEKRRYNFVLRPL